MDFEAWFEMIRPVNALMAGLGVAVGYFLATNGFIINEDLGIAMLSAMLISGAGMVINDYFDKFIDARIKPHRPIPSGRVKASHALIVSLIVFGIGVYLAFTINRMTAYIATIASILLILYSWVLARLPLVGNATVALNTGLLFIFGEAAATGHVFSLNSTVLFALAFLSTFSREIYKDIEDMKGDKISRKTLPLLIGKNWSMLIAGAANLLAVIAAPIPYLMRTMNKAYIAVVSLACIIFVYIAVASILKERVYSKELKIAQLISLLAFLVGI